MLLLIRGCNGGVVDVDVIVVCMILVEVIVCYVVLLVLVLVGVCSSVFGSLSWDLCCVVFAVCGEHCEYLDIKVELMFRFF